MIDSDRTIRDESIPPAPSEGGGPGGGLLHSGMIQPSPAPGLIGKVGRYEILRVLGEGGMGQVLLAREPDSDARVAIKMIRTEYLHKEWAVRRFLSEARHMFKLAHPAVMPVLDVSDRREGPYFVMPYMAGGSLAGRIRPDDPMTAEAILPVARAVAEALDFAHGRGVIHRDLKPSNILLDGDGRAFLADFGLLRTVFNDSMVDVTQQRLEGTVPYLSPAVAEGQAEDTRCDIYAFGCLLYEMLTGQPPYQGPTVEAVLRNILAGPPRPIRELNPRASPTLVRVAEGCMARELRDRYAAMSDVVADLARIADRRDPLGPHGAERSHHVHRAMAWSAAVAAVGLAAWGLWSVVDRHVRPGGKGLVALDGATTSSFASGREPAVSSIAPGAPDGPPMPPGRVPATPPALPSQRPPLLPATLAPTSATGTTVTLWMPLLATFSIGEGTASESQRIVVREPDSNTMRLMDEQRLPPVSESLATDFIRGEASLRGRSSHAVLLEALRTCTAMTPASSEEVHALLSLRYRRAPVESVCGLLAEISGRTSLCHPSILRATLSLDSPVKLTSTEAECILTEALRHNGIAASPLGSSLMAFHPTSMPSMASSGPLPLKWPPTIFPPSGSAGASFVNAPLHEVLRTYLHMHPQVISGDRIAGLVEDAKGYGGNLSFKSDKPLPWPEVAYATEKLLEWHGVEILREGTHVTVRRTMIPVAPPPLPVATPVSHPPLPAVAVPVPAAAAPASLPPLPPGVIRAPTSLPTPGVGPASSAPGSTRSRVMPPGVIRMPAPLSLPEAPEILAEAEKGAPDLLKTDGLALFAPYRGSPRLFVRDPEGDGMRVVVPTALPTNVAVLAFDEATGVVVLGRGPTNDLRGVLRACTGVSVRKQGLADGSKLVGFGFTNSSFTIPSSDYVMAIAGWKGCGFLRPYRSPSTGARKGRSLRDITVDEAVAILGTELEANGCVVETLGSEAGAFLTVRSTNSPALAAGGAPKPRWPLPTSAARPADRIAVSFSNEPLVEAVRIYLRLHEGQLTGQQVSNFLWQAESYGGSIRAHTPESGLSADLVACGIEHLLDAHGVEFRFEADRPVAMRLRPSARVLPTAAAPGSGLPPLPMPLSREQDERLTREGVPPPPGRAAPVAAIPVPAPPGRPVAPAGILPAPAAVPSGATPAPAPVKPGTVFSQNIVGYTMVPTMSGTVVRLTRSGDFAGAVVEEEQAVVQGVLLTVDSQDPGMLSWCRPAGGTFKEILVQGRVIDVESTGIEGGCIATRDLGQVPIAVRARTSGTNSHFVFALGLTAEQLEILHRRPEAPGRPVTP